MSIKKAMMPFGSIFSQSSLIKRTGRRIIFPFYHTISDDHLPYISNLYPLRSIKDFRRDIEYFCKHFSPISIEEVYKRIQTPSKLNKPAFHLSFDDGLKEIHSIIAPILEKNGIPATFFINTDFVDNNKLFYRYKIGLILEKLKLNASEKIETLRGVLIKKKRWKTDMKISLLNLNYHDQGLIEKIGKLLDIDFIAWLVENEPYASNSQIKDLIERGFSIGSHSVDHPRFKNIELRNQKLQLENSFSYLEQKFNIDERLFSFPFGDEGVKAELFNWMYDQAKCKMSFGVSGIKDDFCPFHLHRIPMDECQVDPEKFIKSEYLYFMLKSVFNKNKIKRN